MAQGFASTDDMDEKQISFNEIGAGCYAFTAEGDPNSGVIIGDDSVMVIDAQATPVMAEKVISRIRKITDKPIKHVVLTHYHAVRVLGASAYEASEIISSDLTRTMINERGKQDWDSEFGRFPRLFQAADTIPGLTWPTQTFFTAMSVWLGKREVRLMHLGRGHTMGDIVAWVPDEKVMFSGDLVEYKSACYCGDAHLKDWPGTLDRVGVFKPEALVPGRGNALENADKVAEGLTLTGEFVDDLYSSVSGAVKNGADLNDAMGAARNVMDPKYADYAIYEHCMPFNVARAFDEASGRDHPAIWTAERDQDMWASLQQSDDGGKSGAEDQIKVTDDKEDPEAERDLEVEQSGDETDKQPSDALA